MKFSLLLTLTLVAMTAHDAQAIEVECEEGQYLAEINSGISCVEFSDSGSIKIDFPKPRKHFTHLNPKEDKPLPFPIKQKPHGPLGKEPSEKEDYKVAE